MHCFDTFCGFVTFFSIGVMLVLFPRKARDMQAFIRSKIPLGNSVPFGSILQKGWSVTIVRWQGILFVLFSLFLLQWYLRSCI
jgi:hypothetical protein